MFNLLKNPQFKLSRPIPPKTAATVQSIGMYAHDTAAVLLADKEKEKARKTKRNAEHKGLRTKEAETDDNDDTKGVKEYENIEAFLDQQDTDIKKWKDRWD